MGDAQAKARGTLESHGIKLTGLTAAPSSAGRNEIQKEQDQVAKELKVSVHIVKLMTQEIARLYNVYSPVSPNPSVSNVSTFACCRAASIENCGASIGSSVS